MALIGYSSYKIAVSADSPQRQALRVGDVIRREYSDGSTVVYSLLVVLETGTETIGGKESCYFIGALLEGDEPATGQMLDFVRVASMFDADRSGALYLTASDSGAPFMDVIDSVPQEKALSYPYRDGGSDTVPDKTRYAVVGSQWIESRYYSELDGESRAIRLTAKDNIASAALPVGLSQPLGGGLSNPQVVIISFKAHSSKPLSLQVALQYTDGSKIDGQDTVSVTPDWSYVVRMVSVDYSGAYSRNAALTVAPEAMMSVGDTLDIAQLNIVRLSDLSDYSSSVRTRIGKVKGIVDPVFGVLDGYGAYFQNLYATRNVNIAGTLTAGDENGFSSTFYVGRIHRNVIPNSTGSSCIRPCTVAEESSPTGIGQVWLLGSSVTINAQSAHWREEHSGQDYCFSFWAKSSTGAVVSLLQDEHHISDINVSGDARWRRHSAWFSVRHSEAVGMSIRMVCSDEGILFCSPQLECGRRATQYQPTDGVLSYGEDYGAWFSRGGIGGTIQNPLLRLNPDGSLCSRDGSFVINQDGTGHFAGGRFRWTENTIALQDVTIRWEDLSDNAKENLAARSVKLSGVSTFHYPDTLSSVAEPQSIRVIASEHNFTADTREWYYEGADGEWHRIQSGSLNYLTILPTGHYWEKRNILPIKYIATINGASYEDIFTLCKQYDGSDSYSIHITSSNGTTFRNGAVSTTLTATVLKGGEDVTGIIPEQNFRWTRLSDDSSSDAVWNQENHRGKSIEIDADDMTRRAVFDCTVTVSKQIEIE